MCKYTSCFICEAKNLFYNFFQVRPNGDLMSDFAAIPLLLIIIGATLTLTFKMNTNAEPMRALQFHPCPSVALSQMQCD